MFLLIYHVSAISLSMISNGHRCNSVVKRTKSTKLSINLSIPDCFIARSCRVFDNFPFARFQICRDIPVEAGVIVVCIPDHLGDRLGGHDTPHTFLGQKFLVTLRHHAGSDETGQNICGPNAMGLNLPKLKDGASFPGWFRRIVFSRRDRILRGSKMPTVPLEEAQAIPSSASMGRPVRQISLAMPSGRRFQ